MKKRNYPNFIPETGNLTKIIRNDYINEHIASGKMSKDAFSNEKITGLIASNNTDDKLYFWQLYSILGEGPVHILIKRFYENIFNDNDAPWFRDEFVEIGDVNFHIIGQKKFWLDVMGGGKRYVGGEKRLHLKHNFVKNIMTTAGAYRWMMHMKNTLSELDLHFIHDKRIVPCIDDFLQYFMRKYSIEFDFNIYQLIGINKSKSKL